MTMKRLLLVPFLLLAGCGGSDKSSSSSGGGYAQPSQSGAGTSTSTVKLQDIQFKPGSITVKVGQKITWTNADSVAHNVKADSGADFSSPTLNQGDTFSYTPQKAGTITYECTFHQGMTGTITVQG